MIANYGVTRPLAGVDSQRAESRVLVTRVGLRFPRGLSFDDWEHTGEKLARIAGSTCWCLGDWMVYGEKAWTNRYMRAVEAVGLDYQTLRNYAWVCRRFEAHRRRPCLSFHHHAEVAPLPDAEQDRWLDLAEQHSWSKTRLRSSIRAGRAAAAATGPEKVVIVPRIGANKERLQRWLTAAEKSGDTLEHWIVTSLDLAAQVALQDR